MNQVGKFVGTAVKSEIFLASGVGRGLASINNPEAVASKCNVVCTSNDNRNPQPSPEELKRADYIFHRTFNVGTCTVSDNFPEKIAAIDVWSLLNKEGKVVGSEFGTDDKEEKGNVMANKVVLPLRPKASGKAGLPYDDKTTPKHFNDLLRTEKDLHKKGRFDEEASAAHVSENNVKLKVRELKLAKKSDSGNGHGSVNSIINLKDITVVGTDARVNWTMIVGGTQVKILDSDSELKFNHVTERVGITASGSQSRNEKLWKYLQNNVDDKIDDDVAHILDKVDYFLHNNKLPEKSKPLEVFVVGYSKNSKKCEAYIIGDDTVGDVVAKKLVDKLYEAVGGGGACALHRLSRFKLDKDMSVERARRAMLHALLYSTIRKVGVGGLFQVWAVTPNSIYELGKKGGEHAIDVMIHLNHNFLDREIFVCDQNDYEVMNYYFLEDSLRRYGVTPRGPSCLGYINGRWKLFLVRVENKVEVDELFDKGEMVGCRKLCRRLTYTRHGTTVTMIMFRATMGTLKDLRTTKYLDSLPAW